MRALLTWLLNQYTELVAATRFLSVVPLPELPQRFDTGNATITSNTTTEGPGHPQGDAPLIDEAASDVSLQGPGHPQGDAPPIDEAAFNAPSKLGSAYFPVVGLLLALLLYILQRLCELLRLPSLAQAAVLVVALVLLTGGLHLDGLMDSCDGLLGGRTAERRLEIMRDSRVGSFGVLGGVCVLLLKFALLASVEPRLLTLALFIVIPCARWAMVLALRSFPSARPTGLGATFQRSVTPLRLLFAGAISLLVALLVGHLVGGLLWLAATLVAILLGLWITRLVGGLTGDSYGAIAEISEVVLLLLFVFMRAFL